MSDKENFFVPENRVAGCCDASHSSASGRHKLDVISFRTKEGCFDYTQGSIYDGEKLVGVVQRNYSSFPFCWVEGHPNGHDYLICGEDYQGQTVIELDTGERRDHLSDGTEEGFGFCWTEYKLDIGSMILMVGGCIWACPYEYRFFDFAEPMSGWPEIEKKEIVDASGKWPLIGDDGKIVSYETGYDEDCCYCTEDVVATMTFVRDGLKLVKIDEWVSEEEAERRRSNEEARAAHDKAIAEFKRTDPLFLACEEELKDPVLSPEGYSTTGVTHDGWCPTFAAVEGRWCRRIVRSELCTIDIEWAMKTGPVKVIVYRCDVREERFFDEHAADSIRAAFAYAKTFL